MPALWPWVLCGLAANHLALTLAGMCPRSPLLGPNLSRLPQACASAGQVALTFDDGPDPEITPRVLDLLEAHQARASFFLIGQRTARHPALVREILRRGHSVENHTHSHPLHFAALGPGGQRREILRAQAAILEAGGAPRFFRPPVGLHSPFLAPVLAGTGLRHASWTRRGADGAIGAPARVLRRLRGAGAGDILLLHDGNSRPDAQGRPVVLAVLPILLARLRAAGLSPVPLPEAVDGPAGPAAAAAAAGNPASAARACR
ncbi:polysaccharide deacetylase family protein [Roseomonas sp. E05]|uniref:polysaccharide deacetylase family protein n=1 Tax=Roseomonas sp. E05 TaxID=3046310 RepID=UPI0024B95A89|nr:polysaccharide deacetylase family protein [Roseomonas sp. E05]MDJ0389525.1 polysaccharide deacetylase family protein [Roseomonas sp. E05]